MRSPWWRKKRKSFKRNSEETLLAFSKVVLSTMNDLGPEEKIPLDEVGVTEREYGSLKARWRASKARKGLYS